MTEYIEREKVAELIDYYTVDYFEAEAYFGLLKEDFQQLPSADVAPVMHGWWIPRILPLNRAGNECSACLAISVGAMKPYYCPNCGAKMDGET